MNEEQLLLDKNEEQGEIVIAPSVIEVIIGITAKKVNGVVGMRGTIAKNIAERFSRGPKGKGVTLTQDDEGNLSVDLYTYIAYGKNVQTIASEIQQKVKQQGLYMTGIELNEINIHIVAVIPEKFAQADLEDLLDDEESAINE